MNAKLLFNVSYSPCLSENLVDGGGHLDPDHPCNGAPSQNDESESRFVLHYCFTRDASKLALAQSDTLVRVFARSPSNPAKWTAVLELKDHESRVTGIDWNWTGDLLVSCGADRNIYVWTMPDLVRETVGVIKPVIVLLRTPRALTAVKWCPQDARFAVGGVSRTVAVCHYEPKEDLWLARKAKRMASKSAVQCLAWHPSGSMLAVGFVDCKLVVISTPDKTTSGKFGEQLFLINTSSWVQAMSFSASIDESSIMAYSCHDSTVCFVHVSWPSKGDVSEYAIWKTLQTGHCRCLPFKDLVFVSLPDRSQLLLGVDFGGRIAELSSPLVLDCSSKQPCFSVNHNICHLADVCSIAAFDDVPNSGLFSSMSADGQLLIWQISTT